MSAYLTYIKLAVVLALIVGAYFFGVRTEKNAIEAATARDERVAVTAYNASQKAIAEGLAKKDAPRTEIVRKVETITREVPVYRDCVNGSDVVSLLDAARDNQSASNTDGSSDVPASTTEGRTP